ncbi:hypothetical protein M8J77_017681 [Diaphorina citri]|nr:hypothetical protein M8J77_017681 [Diaphorina citri]
MIVVKVHFRGRTFRANMKTKVSSNGTANKSTIPPCPYEIPISTIYNPNSKETGDVPVVSIYNPNLNQNTRPPEKTKEGFQKICLEKLKAQFHKDQRKKLEFYMALCFLTTLVATGVVVVIMHKSTSEHPDSSGIEDCSGIHSPRAWSEVNKKNLGSPTGLTLSNIRNKYKTRDEIISSGSRASF